MTTVEDDLRFYFFEYFAATVVVAAVLVGAIRLLQSWALASGSPALELALVLPGVALALAGLAALLWAFWQIRRDPHELRPYVIVLLSAVITLLVTTEAFAGMTALLAKHDAAAESTSLWVAERHYLWHLTSAMPVLEAPQTVGWEDPSGHGSSGFLLLLFKLLLIAPLVQIVIASYRLLTGRWHAQGEKKEHSWRPLWFVTTGDAWLGLVSMLALIALAIATLALAVQPSSPADDWLADTFAGGVSVLGVDLSEATLHDVLDCALAVGAVWVFCGLVVTGAEYGLVRHRSLSGMAAALAAYVAVIPLAILVAAMATLALLHADVARAQPAIAGDEEISAAVAWHAWHVLEAVPFLDVPDTLSWSLDHQFSDHWSGAILLTLKVVVCAALIVPIALLTRSIAHRLSPRPPAPAQLDATRRLSALLAETDALMDIAQVVILDALAGYEVPPLFETNAKIHGAQPHLYAADKLITRTDAPLAGAQALFGPGEVSDAAEAAVGAVRERRDALQHPWRPWEREPEVRARLEAAQLESREAVARFAQRAAKALREASS